MLSKTYYTLKGTACQVKMDEKFDEKTDEDLEIATVPRESWVWS